MWLVLPAQLGDGGPEKWVVGPQDEVKVHGFELCDDKAHGGVQIEQVLKTVGCFVVGSGGGGFPGTVVAGFESESAVGRERCTVLGTRGWRLRP